MKRIYLDWAAAAPVLPAARRAFAQALLAFGNPSSPHAEGRAARAVLEDARQRIARLLEVKPEAVICTSGATEANNLALQGLSLEAGDHVLYLPTAHASIVETVRLLAAKGVECEALALQDGAIDIGALAQQVRPTTKLVVVDVVCGETGARWDVRAVRRVIGPSVHLHVDASQVPLVESVSLTRFSADTLTLDSQKVGGVRGAGALVVRKGVTLSPLMRGGGQESGLRPGTESPALIAAFATALEEAKRNHAKFEARAQVARARLIAQLQAAVPDLLLNEGKEQAPHILNLSLPGRDTDYAIALLDQAGFAVSTKSACETNSEGSRVVRALTNDAARSTATLRVSWGPATSDRDLQRFAHSLVRTIRFLDTHRL